MDTALNAIGSTGVKKQPKKKTLIPKLIRDKYLILLFIPGLLYLIIFRYLPMLGVVMAFQDFNPFMGFFHSEWVGLKNFITFFSGMYFWVTIRNTLVLNFYVLIISFPVPIIFALLLNEVRNYSFKRLIQTVSYLPHFISVVVVVGMFLDFLSPSTGLITRLMGIFGIQPVYFMADAGWFRPIYTIIYNWQWTGWNAIIFFAALTGIDQEQYEAAYIDGANRFQRILYITLPGIMPTVAIMFIINIGNIMALGFDMAYIMQNPLNLGTSEIIETFVYKRGILGNNGYPDPGFATAVNLFQSTIGFLMVIGANKLTNKLGEVGIW